MRFAVEKLKWDCSQTFFENHQVFKVQNKDFVGHFLLSPITAKSIDYGCWQSSVLNKNPLPKESLYGNFCCCCR